MIEKWRDIIGYEGYYQVSNTGKVRSLDRVVKDKNGRTMNFKGQEISPQTNESGYVHVALMKNKKAMNQKIHRIVAAAFLPNPNNLPCVNHIDGDKKNNTLCNLEWCSFSYNNEHAYRTGLKLAYERDGEDNPKAKFTNEEAELIRKEHKVNGGSHGTMYLSRKYGVHKDTITNLIKRKTYSEVGGY